MSDELNKEVTPLQKEGECTKAICDDFISKNLKNSNILVTGSNGQLGSEIRYLVMSYELGVMNEEKDNSQERGQNSKFFFTDKNSLDITNKEDIKSFVEKNNINVIINCAAYTAVDKAQSDKENANKINHLAVKYLAEISKEYDIALIHISTDYVFDGTTFKPYCEEYKTNPNSVYGQTKLDGEKAMIEINPSNSIIIRTSWVYSTFGTNFVKSIQNLATNRDNLGIIFDQVGTPTYAKDLANVIFKFIDKGINNGVDIFHYSNEGVVSWYDFAMAIIDISNINCDIQPIETFQYPTPASRPHYSLLNKSKIKNFLDIKIPYWRESLKEMLNAK